MKSFNSEHSYQYGTKKIDYTLVKSRRLKTCEIIVDDEEVIVRSPHNKPLSEIEDLLRSKMNWVISKQMEIRDKEKKVDIIKPTFQDNSTVPYLGRNLKLNIIQSYCKNKNSIELKNNQIFANIRIGNDVLSNGNKTLESTVRSLYENWLAHESKDIFTNKVLEFRKQLNVNPNRIVIKKLKNRWGSATKEGTINLNINLLKAPEVIIDYVIVHELCHFLIKEHSFHFWNLLKKYFPDYPKYVEWLDINAKNLLT